MGEVAGEIEAAGARLVWMLEEDVGGTPGTARTCDDTVSELGAPPVGLCVGDGQTEPTPGVFDDASFAVARGFDMIVARETMEIVWASSHGSPSGNDNPSGDEVLERVREVIGSLD